MWLQVSHARRKQDTVGTSLNKAEGSGRVPHRSVFQNRQSSIRRHFWSPGKHRHPVCLKQASKSPGFEIDAPWQGRAMPSHQLGSISGKSEPAQLTTRSFRAQTLTLAFKMLRQFLLHVPWKPVTPKETESHSVSLSS